MKRGTFFVVVAHAPSDSHKLSHEINVVYCFFPPKKKEENIPSMTQVMPTIVRLTLGIGQPST
jgi:hypothetical protein